MKNRIFILSLTMIVFCCSCTRKVEISEYSELLQINFPKNMNLIYYDTFSELQDYTVHSVYKLSFNQKSDLLDEIIKNVCELENQKSINSCWQRCGEYFSFKYDNKDEGTLINIDFITNNNISILNIYEVKN